MWMCPFEDAIPKRPVVRLPHEQIRWDRLNHLEGGVSVYRVPVEELQGFAGTGRAILKARELTLIPREVFSLKGLVHLDLSENLLAELPPDLFGLTTLESLDLSGNGLKSIPAELGRLSRLRTLNLDFNLLTELPRELSQLVSLDALSMRNNGLRELPAELAPVIRACTTVRFEDNPWRDPLPELFERGPRAVAGYLASLDDQVTLFEAKLLLVGEGNVGKTSLVAALQGGPFVHNRSTTHGIEIRSLSLGHPSAGTDMMIRIWDFGGQEVYRITHQFFFSSRALYAVVWKPREGQEQNEVEGWLRRIRLRVGAGARAIIVATHANERQPELAYSQLQQALPEMLAGQFAVDNANSAGVEDLRDAIAQETARRVGRAVLEQWCVPAPSHRRLQIRDPAAAQRSPVDT